MGKEKYVYKERSYNSSIIQSAFIFLKLSLDFVSPSLNPDEGLQKPKRFNLDFPF